MSGAAGHSLLALERGKHLILMNSEIDLMFGPLLQQEARRRSVVCTSCDGDQYGALKRLIDDIKFWGFELVMAGNIKGYLDRYATPNSIAAEAEKRRLDYRMCTSFTDGTKLNIEMAIVANAYDLQPSQTGMVGPRARHVNEVFECFDFAKLWESRALTVDYILGADPGGGVFAVAYCDAPHQREMLTCYKMGEGPFYLFQRPYHLCHIEAMAAVFGAVERGETFMSPDAGMRSNVFAYSKRNLPAGAVLDGIGGYDCYGQIGLTGEGRLQGLPICLSEGVVLRHPISKDELVPMEDVIHDASCLDFQLYTRALAVPPHRQEAGASR